MEGGNFGFEAVGGAAVVVVDVGFALPVVYVAGCIAVAADEDVVADSGYSIEVQVVRHAAE